MCVQPSKSCDLASGEVTLTQSQPQSQALFWSPPSQECVQRYHLQGQCGDAAFYTHPQYRQRHTTQPSLWCSSGEPPHPLTHLLSDDVCPLMVSMVVAGIPVVPTANGAMGRVLAAAHRFIRFEHVGRHIKNSPSREPARPAAHFSGYQHCGSGHSEIKWF